MARALPNAIRRLLLLSIISAATLPSVAQGKSGDVVSSVPIGGAPMGSSAYRIRYRSIDNKGRPIVVTGAVIVPKGAAPPGGRPIIAWAHGASGIAETCGLSDKTALFGQIAGLNAFLSTGYVVAAPDYQGLGSPGPHPFLVGKASARNILDSVRAARAMPQARASSRFGLWGESQGGFSALWAAKSAASYAPELQLVGAAAAAPPTDLKANLTGGTNAAVRAFLTAYAGESWSEVYDLPLTTAVRPATATLIGRIARNCVTLSGPALRTKIGMMRLAYQLRNVDLATSPRWSALMAENSVTPDGLTMPILIAQGSADVIVAPTVTRTFVDQLCARRATVTFLPIEGGDHVSVGKTAAANVSRWFADRFAGRAASNNCRR